MGRRRISDKQLLSIASDFRAGVLDGKSSAMMCAAVCWPLAGLLPFYGVVATTVESDLGNINHVWLRLSDGRALDPTADQFSERLGYALPAIYLGPPIPEIHPANDNPDDEQLAGSLGAAPGG